MTAITTIRQAVSEASLFRVLSDWCTAGAGKKSHSLKILTAFVSNKGIEAISPFIDVFLADGNHVDIIFGIDRGGTNRDAIRRLRALQTAHIHRVSVSMFRAPAAGSIFHPKLYLYDKGREISFVLGSANLTLPGLGSNLESLLLFDNVPTNSQTAKAILEIWSLFAHPRPPLPANALRALEQRLVNELLRTLPHTSSQENGTSTNDVEYLWRPLSRVVLPRSGVRLQRSRTLSSTTKDDYLLMDILKETRETQVQIPLDIVEDFFGVGRRDSATLRVSVVADDTLTHPIERPLVISSGKQHARLMRRLEMPQIRGLQRPLVVLFLRLQGRRNFAYLLVPQATRKYRVADRILDAHGQQGYKERRYYIGRKNDQVWSQINRLLTT